LNILFKSHFNSRNLSGNFCSCQTCGEILASQRGIKQCHLRICPIHYSADLNIAEYPAASRVSSLEPPACGLVPQISLGEVFHLCVLEQRREAMGQARGCARPVDLAPIPEREDKPNTAVAPGAQFGRQRGADRDHSRSDQAPCPL